MSLHINKLWYGPRCGALGVYLCKLKLNKNDMKAHCKFLIDCNLAGRKYHDADMVWEYLRVGDKLRLEYEPNNGFDSNAVQVIYNYEGEDYLLGYLPRNNNETISAFLQMGWNHIFDCRISKLNAAAHPEEQIHLTVRITRHSEQVSEKQQRSKSSITKR